MNGADILIAITIGLVLLFIILSITVYNLDKIKASPKWGPKFERLSDYLSELHPNRTQQEALVMTGIVIFFLWILFK